MTKTELIKTKMIEALKAHDKETKESLSMLLQALQKTAKDKRADLTEAEENAVILKEIKQVQETIESCPVERTDIMGFMLTRKNLYEQFAPKQMTKKEIYNVLAGVLQELKLVEPTKKDKGKIMKLLMPKVKGKADGKDVNFVVDDILNEEVPYAYVIRFEGKVTVPVNNEEQALYEVKKALNKAVEPFEVWDGEKEYCNPEYGVWHDGFVLANLIEVQEK